MKTTKEIWKLRTNLEQKWFSEEEVKKAIAEVKNRLSLHLFHNLDCINEDNFRMLIDDIFNNELGVGRK